MFLAGLGLAARLLILVLSGNQLVGPFSGTGDQVRYQILADNLVQHHGLTYAGQPTALRAPLYPLFLAAFKIVFGTHSVVAVRVTQALAGLALALICFLLARRWFASAQAGLLAAGLALACPTLIFISAELQTEALAALLTALFLWSISGVLENSRGDAFMTGVYSGLAAVLRFNAALLPVIGISTCVARDRNLRRSAIVCLVVGVIVAPWMVRNAIVFHGRALYSTHAGINLLEGVLTPQRRGEPWENLRIRAAVGWVHPDVETNNASRLILPSEDLLDAQAKSVAFSAWRSLDYISRARLLAGKVVCFWFSTDQLFRTKGFSRIQQGLRFGGVIAYWTILILAVIGWRHLLVLNRRAAFFVAAYIVVVTAAHLPFVMNTRLRIPFIDPLLVVLASGALAVLLKGEIHRNHRAQTAANGIVASV